ncbi:hypothetical protein BCR37DRAFT_377588 [Protomyces lactucae-debilis]|uniref:Uncharacterized protein n=1 Tax=Protomyces lactucae-debilis TaxID=2754530 RepID=A0A1Y2FLE2_PROLT|nr:uncharacterized protein BCR37DRAFT_377588 [Protomyces lactucae-debilis]ORY84812.1 hypothetical protein BCR37DRAFT_377588 [Protomyces lactucae-debilis]
MSSIIVVTLILGRLALLNVFINSAVLYTPQVLGNPLPQVDQSYIVGQDYTVVKDASLAYFLWRSNNTSPLQIAGKDAGSCHSIPASDFMYLVPAPPSLPTNAQVHEEWTPGQCTLIAKDQEPAAANSHPEWFKLSFADKTGLAVYCVRGMRMDLTPVISRLDCKWMGSKEGYCSHNDKLEEVKNNLIHFNLDCKVEKKR